MDVPEDYYEESDDTPTRLEQEAIELLVNGGVSTLEATRLAGWLSLKFYKIQSNAVSKFLLKDAPNRKPKNILNLIEIYSTYLHDELSRKTPWESVDQALLSAYSQATGLTSDDWVEFKSITINNLKLLTSIANQALDHLHPSNKRGRPPKIDRNALFELWFNKIERTIPRATNQAQIEIALDVWDLFRKSMRRQARRESDVTYPLDEAVNDLSIPDKDAAAQILKRQARKRQLG